MEVNKLGMGVMMNMIRGNEETVTAFQKGVGQTIRKVELAGDALVFDFENGYRMKLFDDGQSCCESRYMRTDDNLAEFVGAKLLNARIEDAAPPPKDANDYGDHEIQLLVVETDKGNFVMSNHNEHNGYYGGFSIEARTLHENAVD